MADLPPEAAAAIARAVAAYEPEATAAVIASPGQLLGVLLEAARRAVTAAAPVLTAEYENAITWNTSCTSCARILDSCYAETCRREIAEENLAKVRELTEAMGDRSNEPVRPAPLVKVHLPMSDRRIVEPIRRMVLKILDGEPS